MPPHTSVSSVSAARVSAPTVFMACRLTSNTGRAKGSITTAKRAAAQKPVRPVPPSVSTAGCRCGERSPPGGSDGKMRGKTRCTIRKLSPAPSIVNCPNCTKTGNPLKHKVPKAATVVSAATRLMLQVSTEAVFPEVA